MQTNTSSWRALVVVIIALLAGALGYWFYQERQPIAANQIPPTLANADVIQSTHPVKPFQLTDDMGKPFTNKNLVGHWSMLFFGFTNCEWLCPTTLSTLNKAYNILQKDGKLDNLNVVFISVDPDRDSLKRIKTYTTAFNANFSGATGSEEQLKTLAHQFGVVYMKVPNKDGKGYYIDHSGVILLIDPKGELAAIFDLPHDAQRIAADYEKITGYFS